MKKLSVIMGLLIMSLLFAGQAFAQSTVTISGTVLDELSEPIIGGSVQVKDSKTAAATNIDGQYTIQARRRICVSGFNTSDASERRQSS